MPDDDPYPHITRQVVACLSDPRYAAHGLPACRIAPHTDGVVHEVKNCLAHLHRTGRVEFFSGTNRAALRWRLKKEST